MPCFLVRNPILRLLFSPKVESNFNHIRFFNKKEPISETLEYNRSQHVKQDLSSSLSSSLTISYLINSCGLSPRSALSAAKKMWADIKTTDNPDSILDDLRFYGFSDAHITKIITKLPALLLLNREKIVKPKLDFLSSAGYSRTELVELVCSDPCLLNASLEKTLIPNFEILKSFVGADQQMADVVRHIPRLLYGRWKADFFRNVEILRHCGVPTPNIARLATLFPRVLIQETKKFEKVTNLIREMGFNPVSTMFVRGVAAMSTIKPSWERKLDVYKSMGWSREEVISAFLRHPSIVAISDEKMRMRMDFFANKMHWCPSFLAQRPELLSYSFENRTIPRCSVLIFLSSKGLVRKELRHSNFMRITDEKFVDMYVTRYVDQVPQVRKIYEATVIP